MKKFAGLKKINFFVLRHGETKWNSINKSWSEPANLGYPINSAYSEKTICFGRENKHAYISSIRKGGLGGYDLYRINYEKITIRPVLYLITVKEDSTQIKLDSASIEILNLDNKIFGKYKANPSNGIFSVIIEPGNYKIRISGAGIGGLGMGKDSAAGTNDGKNHFYIISVKQGLFSASFKISETTEAGFKNSN